MNHNHLPKQIVILSDSKPGHYNQSLGIVDQLLNYEHQLVEIAFRSKWRDNILRIVLCLTAGVSLKPTEIWSLLSATLTKETLVKLKHLESADLILSTGSSVAAINLLLGQLLTAKTVTCRRPSPLGIKHFDLAILPRFYWQQPEQENVCRTLGVPNRITPQRLDGFRLPNLQRPKIGLLIGGQSPLYNIPTQLVNRLMDLLLQLADEGCYVLLSTSRRTPKEVEEQIATAIQDRSDDFPITLFAHRASSSPQLKVEHILANSDLVLVTEDSFSMVCEAASSGKPVIILKAKRTQSDWRYHQWDIIYQELVASQLAEWETDQLAKQVKKVVEAELVELPHLRDAEIAAHSIGQLLR